MTNNNEIPHTHPRADTETRMDSGTGMRRDAAGNPQHDTNPSAGGTGRPGMGESVLGLDFARAAALRHHMTTVVFSSTMSPAELTQRVVSAGTDIPMTLNHGRHLDDVTEHRTGTRAESRPFLPECHTSSRILGVAVSNPEPARVLEHIPYGDRIVSGQ